MLARCARCQNNFTTERYGLQKCPHCGSDLMLADPNAAVPPAGSAPVPPAGSAPVPPAGSAPVPPAPGAGAGGPEALPPPPPPPFGGPGGFGPPPGGPPPPAGEIPSPFAERDRVGFFNGYFETLKLVVARPQEFFARVRVDQTGSAVLFAMISAAIGGLVQGLMSWVANEQALVALRQMMDQMGGEQREMMDRLLPFMGGGNPIWQILAFPLLVAILLFLSAGIIHLALLLFRGAPRGFDATLTVVGYSYGLLLLLAVPACGGLIALVWIAVVLIIGAAAAQRCGLGKAAAAVLLPGVLSCCCCGGLLAAAISAAVRAVGGATPVDL